MPPVRYRFFNSLLGQFAAQATHREIGSLL